MEHSGFILSDISKSFRTFLLLSGFWVHIYTGHLTKYSVYLTFKQFGTIKLKSVEENFRPLLELQRLKKGKFWRVVFLFAI